MGPGDFADVGDDASGDDTVAAPESSDEAEFDADLDAELDALLDDPAAERSSEIDDITSSIPRPGLADAAPVDVAALTAERDELRALAQRVQADFDNFRRRATQQAQVDIDRATGQLAEALLPVLDAAEAAYLRHPDEVGPLLNQMLGELRKQGLETLDLDGQPFDPEVAEAVAHEPGVGGEPVVAEVLRSGYRWKGRTLRPAMVRTRD